MAEFSAPLVIRGRVIEAADLEFGGRREGAHFATPDVRRHLDELVLATPSALADLYRLSFEEILDYLAALGERLSLSANAYLQQAFELSIRVSGLGEDILRHTYERVGDVFAREAVREIADRTIGIRYLEGWVEVPLANGCRAAVRAFGARSVHIVAGNVPTVSALSIVRNAITRSDAIFKTPSNDPLTAAAIARTMVDMAPDHPITKHLSVAYWKGGDAAVEEALYQPRNVEKIIAWGGLASIRHVAKYIQPGIDLITLDPKLSSTIIGRDAFADEKAMRTAAERVALDVGVFNQEGCLNARVVYAETGTDELGLARLNRFGALVWEAIRALPSHVSSPARALDRALAEELESLRLGSEWHRIIGGTREGGVIVSQIEEPVEFARQLANRVVNLVPVDSLETAIRAVNAYTQTIGVYPESLKTQLRDRLAFHGAQRLVSLGYAGNPVFAGPQDGMEPLRRMCRWIIDESYDPAVVPLASHVPGFRAPDLTGEVP